MATSFCVSLCRPGIGKLLSSFVFVNVLHQGKKTAEPCDHTQEKKNECQPRPGMKISIEPGNTVTPYLEAGLRAGIISASVFYERQDFPRSQPAVIDVDGTTMGFEQPESRGHQFGAKAGFVF